jgi:hypothetical protein
LTGIDSVLSVIHIELNTMIRQGKRTPIDGNRANTEAERIGFAEEGEGFIGLQDNPLLRKRKQCMIPKEEQLPKIEHLVGYLKICVNVLVECVVSNHAHDGEGEGLSRKALNVNGHDVWLPPVSHPTDFNFFSDLHWERGVRRNKKIPRKGHRFVFCVGHRWCVV